jgi:hypothetical protein
MAKTRIKPGIKGRKAQQPAKGFVRENIRGLPCLLLIVLGIVLVSYIFYLGLQGK